MRLTLRTILIMLLAFAALPAIAQQASPDHPEKPTQDAKPELADKQAEPAPAKAQAETQTEATTEAAPKSKGDVGDDCPGGIAIDDGSVETGYGFVPSSKWGEFVQRFDAADLPSREIEKVCFCWIRGRELDEIEFEVVFYEEKGGRPADEPYARAPGHAKGIPYRVVNSGRFFPVEIEGVTLVEGVSFIGFRLDPGTYERIFICADQGQETPKTLGAQRDDRSKAWDNILQSRDPLFGEHRALMIRVQAKSPATTGQADEAGAAAGEKVEKTSGEG